MLLCYYVKLKIGLDCNFTRKSSAAEIYLWFKEFPSEIMKSTKIQLQGQQSTARFILFICILLIVSDVYYAIEQDMEMVPDCTLVWTQTWENAGSFVVSVIGAMPPPLTARGWKVWQLTYKIGWPAIMKPWNALCWSQRIPAGKRGRKSE